MALECSSLSESSIIDQKVLKFSRRFQNVLEDSRIFQNVQDSFRIFQKVLECSRKVYNIYRNFGRFYNVSKGSTMFQNVLECSRQFQKVYGNYFYQRNLQLRFLATLVLPKNDSFLTKFPYLWYFVSIFSLIMVFKLFDFSSSFPKDAT